MSSVSEITASKVCIYEYDISFNYQSSRVTGKYDDVFSSETLKFDNPDIKAFRYNTSDLYSISVNVDELADIGDADENSFNWYGEWTEYVPKRCFYGRTIEDVLKCIDLSSVKGLDGYLYSIFREEWLIMKNLEIITRDFGYYADSCCDETVTGTCCQLSFDDVNNPTQRVALIIQQIQYCCTNKTQTWVKFGWN